MMFFGKIVQPKTWLVLFFAFLAAWLGKEELTLFLFPGKTFEGRAILFQILLLGTYLLFFVSLFFIFIFLLEKLFVYARIDLRILDELFSTNYKNIFMLLIILVLLIYPLQYLVNFLSFPYPLEYREVAIIAPATAFANGINVYDVENFPEHIYLYGILYPLTLAPFIHLGDSPILVARAYNVFFLLAFLILSFWLLRKQRASIRAALIGCLILLNSMCYIWAINGARPDAPALFFSFLGFYFLLNRNFDSLGILLAVISCLISFYFKQYLLFSSVVITVFLFLFISKGKAYLFVVTIAILGAISFLATRFFFPLYYEYSILHHIVISAVSVSATRMENQTIAFIGYYWVIFGVYFFYLYRETSAFDLERLKKNHFSLFDIKEPLFRYANVSIFDIGTIAAVIVLIFWLGKHNGNIYTYYGELLLPFLLYLIIPKLDSLFKFETSRVLIQIMILIFCVFPFRLNYVKDYESWRDTFSTITAYAGNCENIYDQTPLVAFYKIDNNLFPIYNNGQIEYASTVIPDRGTLFGRMSLFSGEYLDAQLLSWQDAVLENLGQQKFDCVFSEAIQQIENYEQMVEIPFVLGRKIYLYVPSE